MSACGGSEPPPVRPGSSRVLVTELTGPGPVNPSPAGHRPAAELCLCPEKLASLCGTQDLTQVTSMELRVNAREDMLGNFGVYLPNLVQLKLNNSVLFSLRDVGHTFACLQVLWASHCHLQELEGICSFSSLKELYVAFNSVWDLSQVGMLEELQVLDLEGNRVDDLLQVKYVGLCSKLHTLSLEGNPVCVCPHPTAAQTAAYSYRAAVRELIPQLRYLDDVRVEEEEGPTCSVAAGEELALVLDSIRDCSVSGSEMVGGGVHPDSSRPSTSPAWAPCWAPSLADPGRRPLSGSRPSTAPRARIFSTDTPRLDDPAAPDADTSVLTHGAGPTLFCGNPVKAIRARREKLKTAPTSSASIPPRLPIHVPERSYDTREADTRGRCDVLAELRAWRQRNSRRLQAAERDRAPQVLVIQHDNQDEEDEDEDEDEEGLGTMRSDSGDEEQREEEEADAASPDSCVQSLSPDVPPRDASSPESAQLSPDSAPSPTPTPPPKPSDSGNRRRFGVRAQRLRHVIAETRQQRGPAERPLEAARTRPDSGTQQGTSWPKVPMMGPHTHVSHPPVGGALSNEQVLCDDNTTRSRLDSKCPSRRHQDRPLAARPRTAAAALQKHHQHQQLHPHPDWSA